MTQEQESQPNEAKVTVRKLMIDRSSEFRFHAAYLAYSQAWDKTSTQETKTKLNEIISSLSKEEMNYKSFYEKMSQYTEGGSGYKHYTYTRDIIETQRKRDWRKREERATRNARHRGRR
jgi:hypothetical protein